MLQKQSAFFQLAKYSELYRMGKVKNVMYVLLTVRFGGSNDSFTFFN